MKPHLTHVALWTADIGGSVEFYRRHCELEIVHERGEGSGRVVWVGEERKRPHFVIVLIQRPVDHTAPNSFAHFGFSCRARAEVDRRAAAARADGVLELEPRDGGPVVGYYCLLKDPDGNSVEFSYGQTIDPEFFRRSARRPPSAKMRRAARPTSQRKH